MHCSDPLPYLRCISHGTTNIMNLTRDAEKKKGKGADRNKGAPATLGQQIYPRNGGHPRHFLGNIMGYASHSHINDCLFQQILLAFSLYDLRCNILTIRKQIIAF